MGKFNAKHIVEEIQGTRCTLIETGITKNRMEFLKNMLETNGLTVCVEPLPKKENEEERYKIGVTDITFNPVIAIYERRLQTPDGIVISPKYWFQESNISKPYYWVQ